MKSKFQTAAFLTAVCMLVPSMLSCGNSSSGDSNATTTGTNPKDKETPPVTEQSTEPRIEANLPEADFQGYEFRVITRGDFNEHWYSRDISSEEENGDPINDAVFQRNSIVMERYNFKIVEIDDQSDPGPVVKKAVTAGDDAFDMVTLGINGPISMLASSGCLLDLYSVPNMDLSQPWYDQNANASLSIAGKLHATTGELTVMDNDATWAILFNKQMVADHDFPNLYEMVENGTWTIDRMAEMAREVSVDINGDGVHDENDQWGIISESFNTYAYIVGSGCQYVQKDENDIPYFSLTDERIFNAFSKAAEVNGDYDITMYAENFTSKYQGDIFVVLLDGMFSSNKALFNNCGLNRVTMFRSMETDFGILPQPKYDETQENYYCPVSLWCTNSIAIPKTVNDPAKIGHIIEALSAESMNILTPAYYDISLVTKASRDHESAKMLDLIFASRVYDLSNMYDFGGIFNTINMLPTKPNANYASTVEKRLPSAEKALKKIIDSYQNME